MKNITDKGLDNLRLSIVQQATDDYLEHKKQLYRIRDSESEFNAHLRRSLTSKVTYLIKWFRSDYYQSLCSIDGNYMINMLNKKFEEWVNSPESKKPRSYRRKRQIVV